VRPLLTDDDCHLLAELLAELLDQLAGQTATPGRDRAAVACQWRTRFAADLDREDLERIRQLLTRAADNERLDAAIRIRARSWVARIGVTLRHDPRLASGCPLPTAAPSTTPAQAQPRPQYGGLTA